MMNNNSKLENIDESRRKSNILTGHKHASTKMMNEREFFFA